MEARLRDGLRLSEPFHDPDVDVFGLENAVFNIGDTFLEVVAPVREDTTAGRYLARRGGDGGYMAIFQMPDLAAARRRVADLGIRVVWQADLDDMAATHLHPRDVPGAIVSLDWANPPDIWRWAGPAWTGQTPAHPAGGITRLTVETPDPEGLARRWAEVLGVTAKGSDVPLEDAGQVLAFVASSDGGEGIIAVEADIEGDGQPGERGVDVGSARVTVRAR